MMRNLINQIISKLKREDFKIDPSIPLIYIFRFLFSRIISLIYGCLRLYTFKRVFVHYSCVIKCSSRFKFGYNLNIAYGCYINALSKEGIVMGYNVSLGRLTHIECTGSMSNIGKGIKIGDNVGLGTHGFWGGAGGIEVGNDTIFGNYVSLHSENHNYADLDIPIRLQGVNRKGIKIGNNCWIGAKVTILDGTVLGNGCIVAAGAVVRGTFPDNAVIGGVPAKILKMRK